jgi:Tfp pilus assembly protein PilE
MIWAKIIGVGVLALVVYLAFNTYNNAIKETERVKADLATEQANKEIVIGQLKVQATEAMNAKAREDQANKLVKEKADEAAKIAKRADAFETSLAKLRRSTPVVASWADSPVPDAVRQLLRDYHAANPAPAPSDDSGADSSPCVDDGTHSCTHF